jgi:hypothetical protein
MLAISRRRDLLTGLFSIAAMVPAINSIVDGAGVALLGRQAAGRRPEAARGGVRVSVAYQQDRYQVLFVPHPRP